jgi:hypothetical protein
MGTQNNVVGTIFLYLFKNVIHDKADNSHRINVDSGGSKRIRKRRQQRLQFGDAFRSLSNISMKDKFTERATPSLQTYTEQSMAAAYTNSTLGEKECSRLMHKNAGISSMNILRTALPLSSVSSVDNRPIRISSPAGVMFTAPRLKAPTSCFACSSNLWNQRDMTANSRLLKEEIFVGIQNRRIPGFKSIQLLRRKIGDEVEFVTIMVFDSLDAVCEFRRGLRSSRRPRESESSPVSF